MSKSPVKRLYIMEVVSQSVAIYTLFVIMFSERGGLTTAQVGWVLATFSIVTICAEVPTGAIADRFSRKWSIVISKVLLGLGMLTWLIYPGLGGYVAGIALMGISESFSSGAIQAYLYEKLGKDKQKFTHYNSRLWAMMMGGFLIGSALATIFGPQYNLLLILSIISPIAGALIALSLPSDRAEVKARNNYETHALLKNTREAWLYIFRSHAVLYAVSSIVLMKVLVDVLIELIPLYYRSAGASTRVVPLLFFVGNGITVVIFWYSDWITKLLKKRELMLGVLMAAILVITSRLGTVASILGIFSYVRFVRVLFIKQEGEIQHLLIDRHRATVASMYSMAVRLLTALSFVLIGHFASGKSGVIMPILIFVPLVYGLYIIVYRKTPIVATPVQNAPSIDPNISNP